MPDRDIATAGVAKSDLELSRRATGGQALLRAVIADGFDRATFHRLFAERFFLWGRRLLDHEGMTVFIVHLKVIGRGQYASIAGDAFLIDVKTPGDIVGELFAFIGHTYDIYQLR